MKTIEIIKPPKPITVVVKNSSPAFRKGDVIKVVKCPLDDDYFECISKKTIIKGMKIHKDRLIFREENPEYFL